MVEPLIIEVEPLTVPAEWVAEVYGDEPGEDHLYCCNPNRALCGAAIGDDWLDVDDDAPGEVCEACDHIDEAGVPCGAPFCRQRRWLRKRRSS